MRQRESCAEQSSDFRQVLAGFGSVLVAGNSILAMSCGVASEPCRSRFGQRRSAGLSHWGARSHSRAIETTTANKTVQRTGASRFAHGDIERRRRLAPVADLGRSAPFPSTKYHETHRSHRSDGCGSGVRMLRQDFVRCHRRGSPDANAQVAREGPVHHAAGIQAGRRCVGGGGARATRCRPPSERQTKRNQFCRA